MLKSYLTREVHRCIITPLRPERRMVPILCAFLFPDRSVIRLLDWMDRTWSFDLPVGAFPAVLERLRGTPARAEELVAGIPDRTLRTRPENHWSVNEHLGHLDDLHELDARRLGEFLARAEVLSAADVSNRKTDAADHRATPAREVLGRFRRHRQALVQRMEDLSDGEVAVTSVHPRLRRTIRLIDWAQFVADHDDHHLVRAREVLRATAGPA